MSMIQPTGQRARRRGHDHARLRALLVLVVLILIAAGVVYWALQRPDGTKTATPTRRPCPSSSASVGARAPIASVHVQVLNSTTRTGLAASVSTSLKARGFPVAGVGNYPTAYAGTAEVRYGPAGLSAARTLLLQVPGAKLVADKRTGTGVDLVLGRHYQRLSTAAEILKATKTHTKTKAQTQGRTQTSASCSPASSPSR